MVSKNESSHIAVAPWLPLSFFGRKWIQPGCLETNSSGDHFYGWNRTMFKTTNQVIYIYIYTHVYLRYIYSLILHIYIYMYMCIYIYDIIWLYMYKISWFICYIYILYIYIYIWIYMIQSPASNQQLRLHSLHVPSNVPPVDVPWSCEAMNRRGPGGRKEQILTQLPGRHQADDLLGKLWKVQGRPLLDEKIWKRTILLESWNLKLAN